MPAIFPGSEAPQNTVGVGGVIVLFAMPDCHAIVLVSVTFEQPLLPVKVNVATKEPVATDGVNVASAGLAF